MRLSQPTLVCAALFMAVSGAAILQLTVKSPAAAPQTGLVEGVAIQNYAAVAANPYNQAAVQIEQKQAELQARETAVNQAADRQNHRLNYLFAAMAGLLVLILLNFYLDFRRSHHFLNWR